jgi:hypothetical protein
MYDRKLTVRGSPPAVNQSRCQLHSIPFTLASLLRPTEGHVILYLQHEGRPPDLNAQFVCCAVRTLGGVTGVAYTADCHQFVALHFKNSLLHEEILFSTTLALQ